MARQRLTADEIAALVAQGKGSDTRLFSCHLSLETLHKLDQHKQRSGVSKQILVERALRQFLDGQ